MKDQVENVYGGDNFDPKYPQPELQIVSIQAAFHRAAGQNGQYIKRIKMGLSDGKHLISAVFASQTFTQAMVLQRNDIIKLTSFVASRYDFPGGEYGAGATGRRGIVLMITGFSIIRTMWALAPMKEDSTGGGLIPHEEDTNVTLSIPSLHNQQAAA